MSKKILLIIFFIFSFQNLIASTELTKNLGVAQRYLILQKYEEAQSILEVLYLDFPDDLRVIASLQEVYFATSQHDNLLNLLLNQSSREPKNANIFIDLGKLYITIGEPDKAMEYFENAFDLYPKKEMYYQKSIDEYIKKGYTDEVIDIVQTARNNLNDENAFAMKMAIAYELDGDFDSAMDEYGKYISVYPDRFRDVERRIDLAGRTDDEIVKLEKSIHRMFDRGNLSKDRIFQLLARLNQRLNNFDEALSNLINAEKNSNNLKAGSLIYPFGMRMIQNGEFEVAIKAGEYLINTDDNLSERGKYIKADAYSKTNQPEKAYELFQELTKSKTIDIRLKSVIALAAIDFEAGRHGIARKSLDGVINVRNSSTQAMALKMYIMSYLQNDELDEAKKLLEKYQNSFNKQGWFLFLLGEILLFESDFENAEKVFRAMISTSSEDLSSNDAVAYLLILSSKDDPLFKDYIEAKKAITCYNFDEAILILKELANQNSALTINILWDLSNLYFANSSYENSNDYFLRITEDFSNSFYAPLAYEFMGDIAQINGDDLQAYKYFEKIILNYEDAVNIVRVREKARKISES